MLWEKEVPRDSDSARFHNAGDREKPDGLERIDMR